MSDGTKIEWTDATVNAINGCTVLSPGCKHCYAMKQAHRVEARRGLTVQSAGGMVWTGDVRFNEKALVQPLSWRRPRKIFWNAHGDIFHEKVPDLWIDRCFAVMALTPHHIHQVLTKRSDRMRRWFDRYDAAHDDNCADMVGKMVAEVALPSGHGPHMPAAHARLCRHWPLPNVWLGVSVEDQKRADERIPDLLATPAAVRWLSMEPLLGPVDITTLYTSDPGIHWPLTGGRSYDYLGPDEGGAAMFGDVDPTPKLDWIVLGGESGPNARPMHPDWARSVRDQCAAAGVPFLFKQWGNWSPSEQCPLSCKGTNVVAVNRNGEYCRVPDGGWIGQQAMCGHGKKAAGRLLDGVEHNGFPERVAA